MCRLAALGAVGYGLPRDRQLGRRSLIQLEQRGSRSVRHVVVVEYELADTLDELLSGSNRRRRVCLNTSFDPPKVFQYDARLAQAVETGDVQASAAAGENEDPI